MKNITLQVRGATEDLIEKAQLRSGDLLVVGCSSSEIVGSVIGNNSSLEAAQAVYEGLCEVLKEKGIYRYGRCALRLRQEVP